MPSWSDTAASPAASVGTAEGVAAAVGKGVAVAAGVGGGVNPGVLVTFSGDGRSVAVAALAQPPSASQASPHSHRTWPTRSLVIG